MVPASVLIVSCGPCGNETVRHIDPRSVPKSQIINDEAIFKRNVQKQGPLLIALRLSEVVRHPREAQIFERFGYIRRSGATVVITKLGRSRSSLRTSGKYMFVLADKSPKLGMAHFIWETEETVCNEGNEHFRTYGWNQPIGSLTPLGLALEKNNSLYIGSTAPGHEEHPHLWRGSSAMLHSYFIFDPKFPDPVLIDGETLDFKWSEDFSGF
jgi:hypothetical protein